MVMYMYIIHAHVHIHVRTWTTRGPGAVTRVKRMTAMEQWTTVQEWTEIAAQTGQLGQPHSQGAKGCFKLRFLEFNNGMLEDSSPCTCPQVARLSDGISNCLWGQTQQAMDKSQVQWTHQRQNIYIQWVNVCANWWELVYIEESLPFHKTCHLLSPAEREREREDIVHQQYSQGDCALFPALPHTDCMTYLANFTQWSKSLVFTSPHR